MSKNKIFILFAFLIFVSVGVFVFGQKRQINDERYVSYIVNPQKQNVKLYWKDNKSEHFKSIQNLKTYLEAKQERLSFAMNAGMYKEDNSPLGLFIENGKQITPLNTANGNGNFYLKPNGVFYLTTDNKAIISTTSKFVNNGKIKYTTQSGPMLIINGKINPLFKKSSANVNIRNGVGILSDNTIIFAISKKETNFYDFAVYFKEMGCKNALYLDGFVSRTYLPEQNWIQTDGNFGVIIGVTNYKP